MSEHAKDMAIEITPKTETPPVRLPRIVAEINRVASRVRERERRKKKKITVMPKFWKTPFLHRRQNLWKSRGLYARIRILAIVVRMDAFAHFVTWAC